MNWVTELFGAAQLERIEDGLQGVVRTLKRLEKKMSQQEQELDAALAAIADAQAANEAAVAENTADVEALIALVTSEKVDLGDETETANEIVARILASGQTVTSTNAAITAALPPAPPA